MEKTYENYHILLTLTVYNSPNNNSQVILIPYLRLLWVSCLIFGKIYQSFSQLFLMRMQLDYSDWVRVLVWGRIRRVQFGLLIFSYTFYYWLLKLMRLAAVCPHSWSRTTKLLLSSDMGHVQKPISPPFSPFNIAQKLCSTSSIVIWSSLLILIKPMVVSLAVQVQTWVKYSRRYLSWLRRMSSAEVSSRSIDFMMVWQVVISYYFYRRSSSPEWQQSYIMVRYHSISNYISSYFYYYPSYQVEPGYFCSQVFAYSYYDISLKELVFLSLAALGFHIPASAYQNIEYVFIFSEYAFSTTFLYYSCCGQLCSFRYTSGYHFEPIIGSWLHLITANDNLYSLFLPRFPKLNELILLLLLSSTFILSLGYLSDYRQQSSIMGILLYFYSLVVQLSSIQSSLLRLPKLLFSHLLDLRVVLGYLVGAMQFERLVLSIIFPMSLMISSTQYRLSPMKSIYQNLFRLWNALGLLIDSKLFAGSLLSLIPDWSTSCTESNIALSVKYCDLINLALPLLFQLPITKLPLFPVLTTGNAYISLWLAQVQSSSNQCFMGLRYRLDLTSYENYVYLPFQSKQRVLEFLIGWSLANYCGFIYCSRVKLERFFNVYLPIRPSRLFYISNYMQQLQQCHHLHVELTSNRKDGRTQNIKMGHISRYAANLPWISLAKFYYKMCLSLLESHLFVLRSQQYLNTPLKGEVQKKVDSSCLPSKMNQPCPDSTYSFVNPCRSMLLMRLPLEFSCSCCSFWKAAYSRMSVSKTASSNTSLGTG